MITWEYLVDDVYEESDYIPLGVPAGRLMTVDERAASYALYTLGKKVQTSWTMTNTSSP
jgi:hypothetical protein